MLAACGGAGDTLAPGPGQEEARRGIQQDLIKKQEELAKKRFDLEQLNLKKDLKQQRCKQPGTKDCDGANLGLPLQEELDIKRFELEQLLLKKDLMQLCEQSGAKDCDDAGTNPRLGRGFLTNSDSENVSDVDKFTDPTTLAVFSILLTLLATTISLVRGN